MTKAESIAYKKAYEVLEEVGKALTPQLPEGVRVDVGFNVNRAYVMGLSVRIFRDVACEVEATRQVVEELLAQHSLPSEAMPCEIVVTDAPEMQRIYGDGWEYGDALMGKLKKRKA